MQAFTLSKWGPKCIRIYYLQTRLRKKDPQYTILYVIKWLYRLAETKNH